MVQQVKHLALTLRWLGLVLWHAFDLWPGNFDMLWVEEKHLTFKKKKKKAQIWQRADHSLAANLYLELCPDGM